MTPSTLARIFHESCPATGQPFPLDRFPGSREMLWRNFRQQLHVVFQGVCIASGERRQLLSDRVDDVPITHPEANVLPEVLHALTNGLASICHKRTNDQRR